MTKKVFWDDPYLTELETTITSVHGDEVTVAETIFYAFSGGQESDHGTIAGYPVLQATKNSKEIVYTLPNDHDLKVDDAVKIAIAWPRRYQLMRLHFAAEVVLELFYKKLPFIQKIGAHIAEHKARIEFAWEGSLADPLVEIQAEANQLIQSNQNIISAFSDEAGKRRYWKVEGFSQVPCGGTHLNKTGEVGAIQLKRKTGGKGKERIEIYVSDACR
ncbi:MAG: alanyl-tRNA editing protein [Cyanobacteria bacterium J06638_20]